MTSDLKSRIEKYFRLNTELAYIDKSQLDSLFNEENKTQGWGINHIIEVGDSKVFVKKIPLTDLEYQNMFSTKNLYNLPTYYNYGVGSAGFGAFRELVTHIKTTNWVLQEEIENFPLMYHYRIMPCSDQKNEIDIEKHKKYIEKWNDNKNIDQYIIARKKAQYEIVLFLEYIPHRLYGWLEENTDKLNQVANEIRDTIIFLQKKGIIHFDVHLGNIITDNEKIYLTDFGLVLDKNFDLSEEEYNFFEQNSYYDYGEFLCNIGHNLFSIYQKEYGIKDEVNSDEGFIVFLKNIEEIYNNGSIKLDNTYIDFIRKYHQIIILLDNFFTKIRQNNKKDTKYDHQKLIDLLEKTKFISNK